MTRIYSLAALLLCSPALMAAQLSGQGWGDTEAAAKREALANLSSRISVTVRSKVTNKKTISSKTVDAKRSDSVNQVAENSVETESELPILGAEFNSQKSDGRFVVEVVLDGARSRTLYERRLNELRQQIAALNARFDITQGNEAQYHLLMDMLTQLNEYKKLNTVAIYLGSNQAEPVVSETDVRQKLRAVTRQVDSLNLAAKLLAEDIAETGIYVFPPAARGADEITPFAALLKDKLAANLKTVSDPQAATYTMTGEYAESAGGIDVTYQLVDKESSTLQSRSVRLVKAAYAGLETKPKTVSFEQLLKAGVAVSGDLHVDISTSKGKHDLLFTEGEEVELFVKLSEAGYFYVVGHTLKDTEKNSYLLELREVEGPRKFVQFVNADDANKLISIGKFEVSVPFGVEGLQVFASSKDLLESLPPTQQDSATGLYLISASPQEGVTKTRALVRKKKENAQTAEGSLIFTTQVRSH